MGNLKGIPVPAGVNILFQDSTICVQGSLGKIYQKIGHDVNLSVAHGVVVIAFIDTFRKQKKRKAIYGLYRSLLNNMIIGVSQGYSKKLEIVGVGYKVQQEEDLLNLTLGYSHIVKYKIPQNVTCKVIDNVTILLNSIDKQLIGQVAASIRKLRPPEPYKKKGIRYSGEIIISKSGKTTKSK